MATLRNDNADLLVIHSMEHYFVIVSACGFHGGAA